MNMHDKRAVGNTDPIKEATIGALVRVLEPLIELILDAGVTVQELNQLAKEESVRIASKRVFNECGKESKSRVAIITGLSRSEVAKILNSPNARKRGKTDQHPCRRVLTAWHYDPKYLDSRGEPAVLPIYGRKVSFETLIQDHGGGIPVRAMLDELTQIGAVQRLENQRIQAKTRVPILTGLTSRTIAALGERAGELLKTLGHNLRFAAQPLFESTAATDHGTIDMVPIVRREIIEQGTNFINAANTLLSRASKKGTSKQTKNGKTCRYGVTIYYFQDENVSNVRNSTLASAVRRKNLRRRLAKPRKSGFAE